MDLEQKRNEKYRQIADYEKAVVPVHLAIEDTNWQRVEDLVCEMDCQRMGQQIYQEWINNGQRRTGRLIERYGDSFVSRRLREGCRKGTDSQALTSRYGGVELLKQQRVSQRNSRPQFIFGTERAKQVIDSGRKEMRALWLVKHEKSKAQAINPRQYLAERLKLSSGVLSSDSEFVEATQNNTRLYIYPRPFGMLLGSIDFFRLCWQEFHEAEKVTLAATANEIEEIEQQQNQPFSEDEFWTSQGMPPHIRALMKAARENSEHFARMEAISANSSKQDSRVIAERIRKYYPTLNKTVFKPTLRALTAEWYSDLTRLDADALEN